MIGGIFDGKVMITAILGTCRQGVSARGSLSTVSGATGAATVPTSS
jgi:hypothetical protein